MAGLDPAIHAFQATNLRRKWVKTITAWYHAPNESAFLKKSEQKTFCRPRIWRGHRLAILMPRTRSSKMRVELRNSIHARVVNNNIKRGSRWLSDYGL